MISGTGISGGLVETVDESVFGAAAGVCDAVFETSRVGSCAVEVSVHAKAAAQTTIHGSTVRSLKVFQEMTFSMALDLLAYDGPNTWTSTMGTGLPDGNRATPREISYPPTIDYRAFEGFTPLAATELQGLE